jgi:hypothetical protein
MLVALVVLLALGAAGSAAEIRKGAVMHVKPNSIWFEDEAKLTHWQALKTSGDAAALASYEKDALSAREAWQFVTRLTVKVLGVAPAKRQVNVGMKTTGRMAGTTWFLDAGTLVK